jgi:hypothetical protein
MFFERPDDGRTEIFTESNDEPEDIILDSRILGFADLNGGHAGIVSFNLNTDQ